MKNKLIILTIFCVLVKIQIANAQTTLLSEGFESTTSFTVYDGDQDGHTWTVSTSNARTGSKCIGVDYNASAQNNDYLISPYINLPAGATVEYSFYAKSMNSAYLESMQLAVSTNGVNFNVIGTVNNIPTTYTQYISNLSSYAGQSIKVAIICISNDKFKLLVDDILCTSILGLPVLTTTSATSITSISANLGGNITSDGGVPITARGICYSTNVNPTLSGSITTNGTGTGSFVSIATGLFPNTRYYVRAYATNATGTVYGNQITFKTVNPCAADTQVYLTNIAFVDAITADSLGVYFGNYDLPNTISYNPINPKNLLDISKPVRFKVKCKNSKSNGQSIVSGQCVLRTTDPNITILDSTAGLNNVGYQSEAWSQNEFEISVSSNVSSAYTAYVTFVVKEGSTEYITPCIPIPIKPFSCPSYTVDDDNNPDSKGDNDHVCDSGERIETLPYLNNNSAFSASYVAGFFSNLNGLSGIHILDNVQGSSGKIYAQSWWNYKFGKPEPIASGILNTLPEYDFVFDYNYPATYSFNLQLLAAGGFYLFGDTINPTLIRTSIEIPYNISYPKIPTTGFGEIDLKEMFHVYPNPVTQIIYIDSKQFGNSKYEVTLMDVQGRIILKNSNLTTIDIADYSEGTYYLQIESGGRKVMKKIVKLN